MADIGDSRQSFGERLGQWLDFKDAISLYSVLHSDLPASTCGNTPVAEVRSLQEDLAHVRDSLVDAIRADSQLNLRGVVIAANSPSDSRADFVPFHRSYLVHQRSMQSAVSTLRAQLRAALAERSASGRRLVALDGALEQALAVRERSLLAILPLLLGKRFDSLLLTRGLLAVDDPASCLPSDHWLAEFCRDVQAVLLAELDLRLQPVFGLMDMLGKEVMAQR